MLALSCRIKREGKKEDATTSNSRFSSNISKRFQTASFRQLNDLMYKNPSEATLQHLQKNNQLESMAIKYHEGYREKMSKWPEKPLDHIVGWLKSIISETESGRPLFIDMGCGDCELWRNLKDDNCSIISVDFAPPPDVLLPEVRNTADEYLEKGGLMKSSIKSIPLLPNECASAAVFCLSLMGIDWPSFVKEGYRLVKDKGYILIAEVSSRESDRTRFLSVLESLGFTLVNKAECATYFTVWMFQIDKRLLEKSGKGQRGKSKSIEEMFYALKPALLRPCVYRKSTFKIRDKSRPHSRGQPGRKI